MESSLSFSNHHFPEITGAISRVTFDACGGSLTCRPVHVIEGGKPPKDAWWAIETEGMPTRYVRLFDGARSLKRFLQNYGFMDRNACVSYRKGTIHLANCTVNRAETDFKPCDRFADVKGVPQRSSRSGICWYAATCFVMFFSKQMRELLISRMQPDMREDAQRCLKNAQASERLRHRLYYDYAFGDDPKQSPELDGQNGFSQLCILLTRLDIPTIRLFAPEMRELIDPISDQKGARHRLRSTPRDDEVCVLCVRCFRTHWRVKRRIVYNGRRFCLTSVLIGSEHCGHQIGASTCDMRVCRWALADSDASQHDIGPVFWNMPKTESESRATFKERWWQMWSTLVPVTIFQSTEMCDLSPHNRATGSIRTGDASKAPGVVNTDCIYVSLPER